MIEDVDFLADFLTAGFFLFFADISEEILFADLVLGFFVLLSLIIFSLD